MSDELNTGVALGSDSPPPVKISQDLCLYQSEYSKKGQTHQVSSSIIKAPEGSDMQVLAFVVSFEKLFNSDALILRVANIVKYDPQVMSSFKWDPTAPAGYGLGSLSHEEKTLYLVKKPNGKYARMHNFEVLNTEMRALLFKHAYGYDLSLVDFGRLTTLQTTSLALRGVPALPPTENPIVKWDDLTFGLNFLYREFGIVRIRSANNQRKREIEAIRSFPQDDQLSAVEEDANQTRVQAAGNDDWVLDDEQLPPFSYENHFAVFSFYDDFQCLSRGELFIMLQIDGEFHTLGPQKLTDVHSEILKIDSGEEYRDRMMKEEREKMCRAVMDRIVVEKTVEEIKVIVPG